MQPFAYYLLKLVICSAVLFGYYWLFLRNKAFHEYNRFYLLGIIVLSLSLPLLKINITQNTGEPKTNVIRMLQVVTTGDEYMGNAIMHSSQETYSPVQFLPLAYALVSLVFLLLFIRMLVRIRRLMQAYTGVSIEHIHFVNTDHEKGTPFSFFRYIFWNDAIDIQSPAGKRIFRHELAHIQEQHSLDKLFINILLTVFWINPVFWLIRRELNMIHEFTADKRAVEDGDTAAFAAMILAATYPRHHISLTNPFFFSPIKRRLMMLTKNQNPKMNYISRLLVLPLAVVVFAAFTIKAREYNEAAKLHSKTLLQTAKTGNISEGYLTSAPVAAKQSVTDAPIINSITERPITVVIDAGHGGLDKGATTPGGQTEKDLALQLVKKIRSLNKNANLRIILTREDDIFMDVKQKADFVNQQNPDLFISIHLDSSPENLWDSLTGMEVFVSKDNYENSGKSKLFASAIIGSFQNNYGLSTPLLPEQRPHGIYVLEAVNHPAVMIEAGYIHNKRDYAYLSSEQGQQTFAINVLNAINDFSNSRYYKDPEPLLRKTANDTLFYYNNKPVTDWIRATDDHSDRVVLIFADKTSEIITYDQAEAAHLPLLQRPLNPPSSLVPPAHQLPLTFRGKEIMKINSFNDGRVVITYANKTTEIISNADAKKAHLLPPPPPPPPAPPTPPAPVVAPPAPPAPPMVAPPPPPPPSAPSAIKIGTFDGPRIAAESFKKQHFITAPEGYEFAAASVYFSGKGFPDAVVVVNLTGNDMFALNPYLQKCVPGTSVIFDNILLKGKNGLIAMEGKGYSLF